jgi:murein DD-endopeptidase MepM/ murein hydrolase activator NlpD
MSSKRYTIIVTDEQTGVVRRATIAAGPVIAAGCVLFALPVLVGLGAAWKAKSDVAGLELNYQALQTENASYRSATESLAVQVGSLQAAVTDLGTKSKLDPSLARAMDKLPALTKARAMGGASGSNTEFDKAARTTLTSLAGGEDTFGMIRALLESLESRLGAFRQTLAKRDALAAATPSIWPSRGWLTSTMGTRVDPLNGGEDFHPGLDIAGDKGQPVYATAEGTVTVASYSGDYGNLITLDHGFGIETRYGHLLNYTVKAGDHVSRGDIIGHVGATGRATGYHLHYEVRANGRLINPLQLLTQQKPRDQ